MENKHTTNEIPKVIHYCWFGKSDLPELAQKCIASWKSFLPEYELMLWNEDTFDISSNKYVEEAYNARKYAFVSDYVRLYALYHYGGVYMDTDVEVIKPLDPFLHHKAFSGFEDEKNIPTGIIGASKKNDTIKRLLSYYDNRTFIVEGKPDLTTNVKVITDILTQYGFKPNNQFQLINEFAIYPKTYFCPLNWGNEKQNFSDSTHTIHHFAGSWYTEKERRDSEKRKKSLIRRNIHRIKVLIARGIINLLGEEVYRKMHQKLKKG